METRTNDKVYVLTMAIYDNNDNFLWADVIDVFTNKEDADYALEGELQKFSGQVCDDYELDPADIEPTDTMGQTVMDFSSVNGQIAVLRVTEKPILTKNRSWL